MPWRAVVQLLVTGAQVVSKAFVQAVRQEMVRAQTVASRSAQRPSAAGAEPSARKEFLTDAKFGITLDEAKQILNLHDLSSPEEIAKRYEHLFNTNDKARGGSFYLQSKVVRAKERIDFELNSQSTSSSKSHTTESTRSEQN